MDEMFKKCVKLELEKDMAELETKKYMIYFYGLAILNIMFIIGAIIKFK